MTQTDTAERTAAARLRDAMPADMDGRADEIVAKLDAFESALRELAEATLAHNERVAKWRQAVRDAGQHDVHPKDGVRRADAGTYTPLAVGPLIGATLYRTLRGYRPEFVGYPGPTNHSPARQDLTGPHGPVDLREMIRRSA